LIDFPVEGIFNSNIGDLSFGKAIFYSSFNKITTKNYYTRPARAFNAARTSDALPCPVVAAFKASVTLTVTAGATAGANSTT
jgi:hypothetical protein